MIEPEVLPPEPGGAGPRDRTRPGSDRLKYILVGLTLDLLDYLTMGPIGLQAGFVVGSVAAFLLLGLLDVPMPKRLLLSAAAGLYCTLPGTAFVPLGTLLGAFLKLR